MVWDPNPIAFEIFGISVAWYGLSWSIAILTGYFVMRFIFQRDKKNVDKLVPFIQFIFIGSLAGARLFEMVFYQTEQFFSNPLSFFLFRDGGLASHGAILGTILVIYFFTIKNKDFSISYLMDRSIIAATLQGGIVRLGNFMNSELFGTITDVPWAVQFVQVDFFYRHPVQIYEAIWLFACFALFLITYLKLKDLKPFFLTSIFFIVVLSGRVALEFYKYADPYFLIFSKTQTISFVGVLFGIILLFYSLKHTKTNSY